MSEPYDWMDGSVGLIVKAVILAAVIAAAGLAGAATQSMNPWVVGIAGLFGGWLTNNVLIFGIEMIDWIRDERAEAAS